MKETVGPYGGMKLDNSAADKLWVSILLTPDGNTKRFQKAADVVSCLQCGAPKGVTCEDGGIHRKRWVDANYIGYMGPRDEEWT